MSAEDKAKELVASRKASARAQAEARRERVEQTRQQVVVAEEKVQKFETFRARAIRLQQEQEQAAKQRDIDSSALIADAATAGLQDERAKDPALSDETIAAVGQRAGAAVAEQTSQRKQVSGTRTDGAQPEKAAPRQGDVVVASYDYDQMSDTDISMREGERFVIEGWDEGGDTSDWALVRRLRNLAPGSSAPSSALTGYVPYAYLEKASAPVLPPAQPPLDHQPGPTGGDSQNDGTWHSRPWTRAPPPPSPSPQQEAAQHARPARANGMLARGAADDDDYIFAQFDKNHDGTLSTDEFSKARSLFKSREV